MTRIGTIGCIIMSIISLVLVIVIDGKKDTAESVDSVCVTATPEPTPEHMATPEPIEKATEEPIAVIDDDVKALKPEKAIGGMMTRHKIKKPKKRTETFVVTAYCPCSRCSGSYGGITSTGVKASQGRTIAVDPNVIPYGTHVRLNGNEYIAEDCGGAVKGNHIDLFFNSHTDALNWGKKYIEVEILKGEK